MSTLKKAVSTEYSPRRKMRFFQFAMLRAARVLTLGGEINGIPVPAATMPGATLYSASVPYAVGAVVYVSGTTTTIYQCITACTNQAPASSPTYWSVITTTAASTLGPKAQFAFVQSLYQHPWRKSTAASSAEVRGAVYYRGSGYAVGDVLTISGNAQFAVAKVCASGGVTAIVPLTGASSVTTAYNVATTVTSISGSTSANSIGGTAGSGCTLNVLSAVGQTIDVLDQVRIDMQAAYNLGNLLTSGTTGYAEGVSGQRETISGGTVSNVTGGTISDWGGKVLNWLALLSNSGSGNTTPQAWSGPSTSYTVGTLVTNNSNTYYCTVAHSSAASFGADTGFIQVPASWNAGVYTSGAVGLPGAQVWSSGKAYAIGALVTSSSLTYYCIGAVSGSTAPGSDAAHWVNVTNPVSLLLTAINARLASIGLE